MNKICLGIEIAVFVLVIAFADCRSLGKRPAGESLTHVRSSPGYKNGGFQNLEIRPDSAKKPNQIMLHLRGYSQTIRPKYVLPWVKTDLRSLRADSPTIVWFGHSSLLIKTAQGNILTDPVFSNHAGPVPGLMTAFAGTTNYHAEDMPDIDVLIISHDHYDHLDYQTVKKLKDKVKLAVVPVGIAADLIYWGYDPKKIIETNWGDSVLTPNGLRIIATPAQHHSNRTYSKRQKTLWASYVIETGNYRIFFGGDGGYSKQFKQIGHKYGPFDLALLECGQYGQPYYHLALGEPARVAVDLKAKMLQPIHWAKFREAERTWTEPIETLIPAAQKAGMPLNIPRIGEPYTLGNQPKQTPWWRLVKPVKKKALNKSGKPKKVKP